MKTNKINKLIKGNSGIAFVRYLKLATYNDVLPCVQKRGGDNINEFIKKLLEEYDKPLTIAFVADDRQIIRRIDTAVKHGLVFSRGMLIEMCDEMFTWCNDIKKYISAHEIATLYKFIFQCLDICSYIRESETNILEFNSDKVDSEVDRFFSGRYYGHTNNITETLPILSARYNIDSFTKIVKTNYFSYLDNDVRELSRYDIRVHAPRLRGKVVSSEINLVRNEIHDKLKEIQI